MTTSKQQFFRVAEFARRPVTFFVDGKELKALSGDTVLTAMLTNQRHVRQSEFGGQLRAGFCLIAACQDCWIWMEDGTRVRACSTFLQEGVRLRTSPAIVSVGNAE